jgi:hypothetical protein
MALRLAAPDTGGAMNTSRLFRIANRIHLLLLKELGQGIDMRRMTRDTLYARDVLLVCDVRPGSDLASLAQHFRDTRATLADLPVRDSGADSSGFGNTLNSLFGSDFAPARLAPPPRRWFSPARWVGL